MAQASARGCRRVAEERTEKNLRGFFESLTAEVRAGIQFVASDAWKPHLKVITEQIPAALHVLDGFHIMRNMNVAIDEVRRAEAAQIKRDGVVEPTTKKAFGFRTAKGIEIGSFHMVSRLPEPKSAHRFR